MRASVHRAAGLVAPAAALLLFSGAATVTFAQDAGSLAARTEKGLYVLKVVEPGYDVTVTETERAATSSTIDIRGVVPTITAGAAVLFRAAYDIATARQFAFVFLAPLRDDDTRAQTTRDASGRHLSGVHRLFLTNDPKTPLRDLLGTDYSEKAQQQFDKSGYMSVAQLQLMFGGTRR